MMVRILVVSGFLGSGKSSLLRCLLKDVRLSNARLIINEFGEVPIDHVLLRVAAERTRVLSGGCLCCAFRDDLSLEIRSLIDEMRVNGDYESQAYIIIETSGLADPVAIQHTLVADPVLRNQVRLQHIVVTVDATNFLESVQRFPEVQHQVVAADTLVITKRDLADDGVIETVLSTLNALNPAGLVVFADHGVPDVDLVDRTTQPGNLALRENGAIEHQSVQFVHTDHLVSGILELPREIDWSAFVFWLSLLLHRHGAKVLRVKGIVHPADSQHPVAIHAAQHVMHYPEHIQDTSCEARNRLVVVTRGLPPGLLAQSLAAFQSAACRL
uniref:GTP-binding protein n=1 Tax=Thermorudis peleae TaxID=1382356 RepID=A0A831T989_9BACT